MLYQILTIFSLLFTFTVLIYWPFIHFFNLNNKFKHFEKLKPIFIGIAFAFIGITLTYLTLNFFDGLIISARIIPLLFCGLLGGPWAVLIAGGLMMFTRLIYFPINEIGIIMVTNFSLTIIFLFFYIQKKPITYQTIHKYFFILLFEISVILLFYYNFSIKGLTAITIFNTFSIASFYAILIVLKQSQSASDRVKKTFALSQVDYLTQLPNNYAIDAHLKQLMYQTASFSYLQIDVDYFKRYNFTHSYQIGDKILEEFAYLLRAEAQKKDAFVGRIGGEEFCYILANTPPAKAVFEAEQLRQLIAQHTFLKDLNLDLHISVSIGVSTFPENGAIIEQIHRNANLALQSISSNSVNRVCHYNQYLKEINHN